MTPIGKIQREVILEFPVSEPIEINIIQMKKYSTIIFFYELAEITLKIIPIVSSHVWTTIGAIIKRFQGSKKFVRQVQQRLLLDMYREKDFCSK